MLTDCWRIGSIRQLRRPRRGVCATCRQGRQDFACRLPLGFPLRQAQGHAAKTAQRDPSQKTLRDFACRLPLGLPLRKAQGHACRNGSKRSLAKNASGFRLSAPAQLPPRSRRQNGSKGSLAKSASAITSLTPPKRLKLSKNSTGQLLPLALGRLRAFLANFRLRVGCKCVEMGRQRLVCFSRRYVPWSSFLH